MTQLLELPDELLLRIWQHISLRNRARLTLVKTALITPTSHLLQVCRHFQRLYYDQSLWFTVDIFSSHPPCDIFSPKHLHPRIHTFIAPPTLTSHQLKVIVDVCKELTVVDLKHCCGLSGDASLFLFTHALSLERLILHPTVPTFNTFEV